MRSQSMPRFARMVGEAMQDRGHQVTYWAPQDRFHRLFAHTRLAKWAGYVDQYLLFPLEVKRRLKSCPPQSLYVFCDQALGPWVPLVAHLPHVVHAHDLLALRSALGLIPENPTSFTGRLYQRYIRHGFQRARHFISVSHRTRRDLDTYGGVYALTSEVVYNGLNYPYRPMRRDEALATLQGAGAPLGEQGHILHIGGGQWYKNTAGVIQLYAQYASRHAHPLPLLMVSPQPTAPDVLAALAAVPAQGSVIFKQGLDNEAVRAAYSLARALLFPSLAEGFGWPIIEAQACGCPVITTDEAPMNEIGGPLTQYLPVLRTDTNMAEWSSDGADRLEALMQAHAAHPQDHQVRLLQWAGQFTQQQAIDAYARIYERVLACR
ncbi:glycosyltransferase [Aquabacterium sp.]|uniref:glycosyltransferase n=1 Tax=Aquabacterium sp. TaxID=1872578 RepID=UPI0025BD539B|nr:glycosyltransferase [Aquabacterium sp.]